MVMSSDGVNLHPTQPLKLLRNAPAVVPVSHASSGAVLGETDADGLTDALSDELGLTLALCETLAEGETLADGDTEGETDADGLKLGDTELDGLTEGLTLADGLIDGEPIAATSMPAQTNTSLVTP